MLVVVEGEYELGWWILGWVTPGMLVKGWDGYFRYPCTKQSPDGDWMGE